MSQWQSPSPVHSSTWHVSSGLGYRTGLSKALLRLVSADTKCHGWQETPLKSRVIEIHDKKKKKKRKPLIRGTGWILQRNIGQKINSKCASLWARVQACLGGGSGRRFRKPQEWKMGMLHLHLPFLQRVGSSAAVTHRTSPHSDKEGSRPPPSCQAPASWPHSHWNLTYSFTNDYVGCTSVTCVGSSLLRGDCWTLSNGMSCWRPKYPESLHSLML